MYLLTTTCKYLSLYFVFFYWEIHYLMLRGGHKLKFLRANDGPFMNKKLRKEVMLRSKFKKNL